MDRKFLRPGWIVGHLLVVLAALVCLRLGRWQWHRMHEGGTIQNLGYAVLWPVFGAAFIYMWVRFLQLEKLKDAEDDAELTALAGGPDPAAAAGRGDVDPASPRGALPAADGKPTGAPQPEPTAGSSPAADPAGPVDRLTDQVDSRPDHHVDDARTAPPPTGPQPRPSRNAPSRGVTVAIAVVGGENDDDPELAAYNRALAALAEKDHRRAR